MTCRLLLTLVLYNRMIMKAFSYKKIGYTIQICVKENGALTSLLGIHLFMLKTEPPDAWAATTHDPTGSSRAERSFSLPAKFLKSVAKDKIYMRGRCSLNLRHEGFIGIFIFSLGYFYFHVKYLKKKVNKNFFDVCCNMPQCELYITIHCMHKFGHL